VRGEINVEVVEDLNGSIERVRRKKGSLETKMIKK